MVMGGRRAPLSDAWLRRAVMLGALAVAAAMALAVSGDVAARHMDVGDPRDTTGPLDVRRVETGGKISRPVWRIVTFSKWNPRGIFERGFFVVHLDMRGDDAFEHYVLVHSNGRGMRARLFRERANKPARDRGPVEAWRKNARTVSIRLRIGDLVQGSREHYRWRADSLYTSKKCPNVCIDRIPDEGAVIEPLLLPEPTPEPTPEPEPEPSP